MSFKNQHSRFDLINPICILILCAFGLTFIYSAQVYVGGGQWKSQAAFMILGAGLYFTISMVDYKIFLKLSHWIYILAIIALFLVFSPIGKEHYGARRWVHLGVGPQIQPVELAKLSCIIIAASILTRSEVGGIKDSLQVLGKLALAICFPLLLILAQPDLGSSLTIPPIVFAQLYVSNLSKKFFSGSITIFAILVGIVALDVVNYYKFLDENDLSSGNGRYRETSWVPLHDYQRDRILTFAVPDKVDSSGKGWNRKQSMISVGSGGITGKGWTNGRQAQLGYLPRNVAHNDFIFSVIAEESGFLGSAVVISLFGLLLGNGVRIASMARDRFGTLLALGVVILFSVHTFVNIAMTIGLIPITGLPLPFLSHGGTFMLSCCVLQGLVQSVYRFRKDF
ncbi:FtsW/RodA/SpoVE family cell cycle protein [Puniceicoccaceae bacterium K14]|nr:FtsW/RodA/SpoVE family cell cycle protein [Puniceicoccaceae bacterium K14]